MLDQEYYRVPCSNLACSQILRLRVSEKDYRKTKTVSCLSCGLEQSVEIPFNVERVKEILATIDEIISEAVEEKKNRITPLLERLKDTDIVIQIAIAKLIVNLEKVEQWLNGVLEPEEAEETIDGIRKDDPDFDKKLMGKLHIKF